MNALHPPRLKFVEEEAKNQINDYEGAYLKDVHNLLLDGAMLFYFCLCRPAEDRVWFHGQLSVLCAIASKFEQLIIDTNIS